MFEFEIPDYREITEEGDRMLLEVLVKSNGIWQIHKSDVDKNWPSDFHAHNVDAANEVLDLYTGGVYDKRTKRHLRNLPRKAQRYICSMILQQCKEPEILKKCKAIDVP